MNELLEYIKKEDKKALENYVKKVAKIECLVDLLDEILRKLDNTVLQTSLFVPDYMRISDTLKDDIKALRGYLRGNYSRTFLIGLAIMGQEDLEKAQSAALVEIFDEYGKRIGEKHPVLVNLARICDVISNILQRSTFPTGTNTAWYTALSYMVRYPKLVDFVIEKGVKIENEGDVGDDI